MEAKLTTPGKISQHQGKLSWISGLVMTAHNPVIQFFVIVKTNRILLGLYFYKGRKLLILFSNDFRLVFIFEKSSAFEFPRKNIAFKVLEFLELIMVVKIWKKKLTQFENLSP